MKKISVKNLYLKKDPSKLLEKINNSIDVDSRLYKEDIEASIVHCKIQSVDEDILQAVLV